MPIIIRIKRGDIENLNDHVLRDGELAVSRNRIVDSGPQRDETIPDFYFRVGDGTSVGGIVPGAASIGVAIQFALSAIGSHNTLLEDLTGDYWTPWLMRDFNSPFGKDYRSSIPDWLPVVTNSCLIPDVWESTPNIHLGYGSIYFDGTSCEFCHTGDNPYRFENHRYGDTTKSSEAYLNAMYIWGRIHNYEEIDVEYQRCGFGMRSQCVVEKDTTYSDRLEIWAFDAIVSNDATTTEIDAGCYRAGIVNNMEPYITSIGRLKDWYGFKCNYMDCTRWYEENDSSTSYIRNFYGFYVAGHDDNFLDGHAYGGYVRILDSGPGDGNDDPDTAGWDTSSSGVTRLFNGWKIGATATKAFGYSVWYVGTDDQYGSGTTGAASATALYANTVGHKDFTTVARGINISNVVSGGLAYGSLITTIYSNSENTGIDGDLSVGYYVQNVNRSGSDVWSFGFLQKTSTGTSEFDKHACFGAVDVDSIVTESTLYGLYLKNLGSSNIADACGIEIDTITCSENLYGLKATNMDSQLNLCGTYIAYCTANEICGFHFYGNTSTADTYGVKINDITGDTIYGIYIADSTAATNSYSIYTTESSGNVHIYLPTSPSGLVSGDWYSDSGTVKVV